METLVARGRRRPNTVAAAVGVALTFAVVVGSARDAHAQACCASAGLVVPTRLRSYEDVAVGIQVRGRSVYGAFAPGAGYSGRGEGESEWSLGQDLFAAVRFLDRGQAAVLLPFVETWRAVPGTASAGGGVGDLALASRWDLLNTGERHPVPGVSILAGLVFPSGRPPERAGDALAAGATGQGAFEGTAGLGLEYAWEPYFVAATFTVALRASRQVNGIRQSFAPRFNGLLAAGRMLPKGATIGVFASGMAHGRNSAGEGPITGSDASLLTVGAAGTLSLSDTWRLQGTLSGDPPVSGVGRNQPAGAGLSLSIMRLWL